MKCKVRSRKVIANANKLHKNLNVVKRSNECFNVVKKGVSHSCTVTAHINNLEEHVVNELEPKDQEKLITSLLKNRLNTNNNESDKKTHNINLKLTQKKGGKPLSVIIKLQPKKADQFLSKI